MSIQTFPQGCNTAGMGKKSREKSNQNNLYLQRAWSNSTKAPKSRLQLGIDPKPCCHRRSALGASWEGDGSTGTVVLGAVLSQARPGSRQLCQLGGQGHRGGVAVPQPCHGKVAPPREEPPSRAKGSVTAQDQHQEFPGQEEPSRGDWCAWSRGGH